ncbi:MAG TPA: amino acid permease [Steroidobacteraceae bacterium]|jgi:APA family basic amino acid/polyamine antiporter|nr:amino acid permease [Steroidobacteraceae bacterium]
MSQPNAQTVGGPALTRGVGTWAAIAINVTNMIGAGVFLKTRVMTCNVGSAKTVMLVWVAAGLLSLAGTFCYSEVAALMPEAGGDYVYLRRAFGRLVGFLFGWMAFAVFRSGAQAALAGGLAIFMNVALGGALARWHPGVTAGSAPAGWHAGIDGLTLATLTTIWLVTLINCGTVTTGGRTALWLTIAKIALVLGVGVAAFLFAPGSFAHFAGSGLSGTCEGVASSARGGIAGFGAAMLGALWAYDGWNNIAPLAGEIRDPQKNLPRAFIGGTLLVAAIYLFVNAAYYYTLTPLEIASVPTSSSVATEVLRRFLGPAAVSLTAAAMMISSFGSLHASVLSNSRIPFAMAREGLFFRGLAKLSPRSNVPVRALIAQGAWASVLAVSGTYDTLTDSVIFASWLFYGLAAGSLFIFRRTLPDAPRAYRASGYPLVPIAFLIVTLALLVNTFVATPRQALQGVFMLLAGLPFYWYWSRRPRPRS